MMESYSLKAVLSVADQGFTSKMRSAANSLENLESGSKKATTGIMGIAKGIGVFKALAIAGNTLKESLSGAIDRFDTMNRFPKVMEQMGFSADSSNKSIQKLSAGIQGLPTSLDGITASTQRIAVLTGDLDKATDTSLALNNAFLASGAVAADAERGLTQYVQMLSKGTVDMQSWRTLQETMGYALSETAKQLGITSGNSLELYDAIQSGSISFGRFNDALVECSTRTGGFAEKAKTASMGIKTSFTNLGIAVTRGMANTVQSVDDAMNRLDGSSIQQKIESVTDVVDDFFESTAKGATVAVQAIDILTPSVATAAAGFVAFQTALRVQDGLEKYHKAAEKAKTTVDAFRNAEQLATQAKLASEKATRMQEVADKLAAKAREASAKATKSETAAKELSVSATKTKSSAEKTAAAELKVRNAQEKASAAVIKLKAAEEKASASATKSKAVQEKAASAVTKAKANVDKTATALEVAKTNAAKAGATAETLSARAETIGTAATKAKSNADKDALGASVAKANADKAEAMASALSTKAETAQATATEAGNVVQAKSSMLAITKTAVLAVLSGKMGVATAAQWAWNAAMTANPIGTVIMATTALIAVTVAVSKAVKKLEGEQETFASRQAESKKSTDELVKSLKESKKAYDDAYKGAENSAGATKSLTDKVIELSSKENKSAADKKTLKSQIELLNQSMEGLNLQYDEETDKLNMTTSALKNKAEAYKEQTVGEENAKRYIEVLKEQEAVEKELTESKRLLKEAEDKISSSATTSDAVMQLYTQQLTDQQAKVTELQESKKSLAAEEEALAGKYAESEARQSEAVKQNQAEQQQALAESIANQSVSLEQLSEAQQSAVESMKSTWQSYKEQATNMFDTLSDKSELSVAEMTANLQENQRVIGDWANNIETLASRGIDEGLLEQLRQAGPESAGYVNAMVNASDGELQALSTVFANGGETATTAFKTALNLSDVPEGVMNLVTQTEQSLRTQIEAADFPGIGKNVGQGLENGIGESTGQAATAASNMGQEVNNAAANAMGIHSPSTVFMGYGQNLIQGLIQGIQTSSGGLNAALTSSMASAGQAAVTAMNNSMKGIQTVNTSAFSKIAADARVGMSTMTGEVQSGVSKSNVVMQNGMKVMNTLIKSSMNETRNSATNGMNQFVRTIDKGMDSGRTSVSRGSSGMISALSSLRSGFYSSGYNASLGLAGGVNAGAGAAIAAANRLANRVAATMRNALQVHSPSRITRKIGEYTTEGFVIGILNDVGKVKSAALEVAEAASLSGNIARDAAYAGTCLVESDYTYAGTVDATYTIIVPVNLDGREVARASAKYTKDELNKIDKLNKRMNGVR